METACTGIIHDPRICGGRPVIAGTRFCVQDVVAYVSLCGGDVDLAHREEMPQLTRRQIDAALDYYHRHRAEIDESLARRRTSHARHLERQSETVKT